MLIDLSSGVSTLAHASRPSREKSGAHAQADCDELCHYIADGLRRVDFVRAGRAEQRFDLGKLAEDEPTFFSRLA